MGQRSDELSSRPRGMDAGDAEQDIAWRPVESSMTPVDRVIFDTGAEQGATGAPRVDRVADAGSLPAIAGPPILPLADDSDVVVLEGAEGDPTEDDPELTEKLAEIAQTRDEMRQTLEAIGEKLNPQTVIEEAKESVREAAAGVIEGAKESVRAATIGKVEDAVGVTGERVGEAMSAVGETVEAAVAPAIEAGSSLVETVRANPLPAALVALGTGWLLLKRPPRRPAARLPRSRYLQTGQRGPTGRLAAGQPMPGTLARGYSTTTYRRNDMADKEYRAGRYRAAAYQSYPEMRPADRRDRLGGTVGTGGQATGTAGDGGGGILQTVQRNPLPAALAGLGLAWMYMSRGAQENPTYEYGYAAPYGGDAGYEYEGRQTARADQGAGISDAVNQAQRAAGSVVEQVGDRVGDAVQGARQAVGQAAGAVGDTAGRVVEGTQQTVGQAAETVGETAGDLGSALLTTIKQNPLPAALAGLSLGWLYMSARDRAARDGARSWNRGYDAYGYRSYGGGDGYAYGQAERQGNSATGTIGDRVGDVVQGAQETVGQAAGQVGDTVGQVVQGAQQAVGQAADVVGGTAAQVAGGAQQTVQTASSGMGTMLHDNPLVAGVLATGLGIAVGLSLPTTEPENRLMGPAKEALTTKAGEAAQETVQKVQSVAHEALDTAKKEARHQEILPEA